MRLARICLLIILMTPGVVRADRLPIALSGGLGLRLFNEAGTELVLPVQMRIDISSKWSLQFGEDLICSSDSLCALLGFYRAGVMFRPIATRVSPYAYGYAALFIHTPNFLDERPREYNAGLHWAGGLGTEVSFSKRIGMYAEAGLLGDTGGRFQVFTGSIGILLRVGEAKKR